MKSKTAAAGYKEATAGITHSQKLLRSPECMQIVASQIQETRSIQQLSSPLHLSFQTQRSVLLLARVASNLLFLQGRTEGDAVQQNSPKIHTMFNFIATKVYANTRFVMQNFGGMCIN